MGGLAFATLFFLWLGMNRIIDNRADAIDRLTAEVEAQRDEAVDFIMTFEEVASVLAGLDIQMEQAKPYSMSFTSVREAHGFAQAAVQSAFLETPPEVKGTETLFTAMALHLWPDSMTFPVNRYGDWRDRLGKFAKLTKRESIVRFLRDRLAR